MNLLEAIHQGADLKTVDRCLQANPELLNKADAQGNTPLHYAVAQHNVALIGFLIKRGADVKVTNHSGETAADWFREYVASTCYYSDPAQYEQIEVLRQEIAEDNIQFIADALKLGVSRALRFSQGKTLLHFAVEAQRKAIIELILDGISHPELARLLHVKDSQEVTPLALAQQLCQSGTRQAQEIFSYLQEKQRLAAALGNVASTPQTQPLGPISLQSKEVKALADCLSRPLKAADFVQLNPLRLTLVKLAYVTCRQALQNLRELSLLLLSRKPPCSVEVLLQRLFGVWNVNTYLNFQRKLCSVSDYLTFLVQQKQADQVVHFSAEKLYVKGRCCHADNKIFLSPIKTSVATLVLTLIHEVTHKVERSYDFFAADDFIDRKVFFINLEGAYQLAASGVAEKLTPEKRKIFEVRQLLEEGFSDRWQQNLYRWMALNSAETLAVAIVALAADLTEHTSYLLDDRLLIHPDFLSVDYVAEFFRTSDSGRSSPKPVRSFWKLPSIKKSASKSPHKSPRDGSAVRAQELPAQVAPPGSPATLSTGSGGSGSSPNTSTLGSPPLAGGLFPIPLLSPLPQAMAAQTSSAVAAGPSGSQSLGTQANTLLPEVSPSKLDPNCSIT